MKDADVEAAEAPNPGCKPKPM